MADPREIEATYERLARLDHYELLGVEREASPDELKRAYVVAAKRWHVDAWAGQGLPPEASQKVQTIFKAVGEAYATLSKPAAKAEYDVKLARTKKGLSTDVTAILQAESKIDAGLAHIRTKRWPEARAALEEAKHLNKDDPLIWTHLAYAGYRADKATPAALSRAKAELERALKVQEKLPEALVYLGMIHFEHEDFGKAKLYLNRCLGLEPRNVEATRLLRLATSRAEKQKKKRGGLGGLLDSLLGK